MAKLTTKLQKWLKQRWEKRLVELILEVQEHKAFHVHERMIQINTKAPNVLKARLYPHLSLLHDVRIFTVPTAKDLVYLVGKEEDTETVAWWLSNIIPNVENAIALKEGKRKDIMDKLDSQLAMMQAEKQNTFDAISTRVILETQKKMAITNYVNTQQKHKHIKKRLNNAF